MFVGLVFSVTCAVNFALFSFGVFEAFCLFAALIGLFIDGGLAGFV